MLYYFPYPYSTMVNNLTLFDQAGDTMFGEYPWHAAILKRDGHEMVYVCGGSLIDDRHIVTAAHCVNK